MIEIQKIDFKNKTIDNVKCSYGNVKDIQLSMVRNTFKINVIYNEGETITTEYKKPKNEDTIDEVNMNIFDKETEDNQQEQMNISCKVEEQQEEVKEPKEEEPKEVEPEVKEEPTEKSLSIEELKELLTEKKEKKTLLLVMVEQLNKCMTILKVMTFIHYYKKNKR